MHVVSYGSDEEQFIKWNERLQHCAAELELKIDLVDVFEEASDFMAFQKDIAILKDKDVMLQFIVLLHGADNEKVVKSMENLFNQQTNARGTYQTKTTHIRFLFYNVLLDYRENFEKKFSHT